MHAGDEATTRPEAKGFRDQGFVLPEVDKTLEFRVLWLLKKALPSKEEPDISLSVMNSFYTLQPEVL